LLNKAGEELLGKTRNELMAKNDYDFFPKEQADFFISKDKEVLAKGVSLDIPEEPITVKDKTEILHTRKIPIKDENGISTYLLGISEVISERKKLESDKAATEKMLQQSVQQVKLILENIGEGVIVVDKYGEIVMSNQMAAEIVGIKEDDVVYTPVDWAKDFDLFYPDEDKIFPSQYLPLEKALLRGEATDNLQLVIQDPVSKTRKLIVLNGRPIFDENHVVVAAVTTMKDITEFKELQESLKTSESKYRDLIGFKRSEGKGTDINDQKK
jgi:PAS domain-containing protein